MTKGEQMTVPRVVSSGAPVASSAFGDRLRGVLTRPSRTFDAMTDPDAWVFPAIVMFLGYLVYMLASGVRAAELMHRLMDESGSKITSQREGGEFLSLMSIWMGSAQIYSSTYGAPFAAAASWMARTAIFMGLGRLLGGAAVPWGRVASMVGWSWTPIFIHYVGLGLAILLIPAVANWVIPISTSGAVNSSQVYTDSLRASVFLSASPFVLWNLALCVCGVRTLFRLSGLKAAVVVLLPTAAQLGLQYAAFELFRAFGSGAG